MHFRLRWEIGFLVGLLISLCLNSFERGIGVLIISGFIGFFLLMFLNFGFGQTQWGSTGCGTVYEEQVVAPAPFWGGLTAAIVVAMMLVFSMTIIGSKP